MVQLELMQFTVLPDVRSARSIVNGAGRDEPETAAMAPADAARLVGELVRSLGASARGR